MAATVAALILDCHPRGRCSIAPGGIPEQVVERRVMTGAALLRLGPWSSLWPWVHRCLNGREVERGGR